MGYIKEPENVDLLVEASVFTEEVKQIITQAIARYKKTGQKPDSVQILAQDSVIDIRHIDRRKDSDNQARSLVKKRTKI